MIPQRKSRSMSRHAKFITGIVLVAVGLAVWRFLSEPAGVPLGTPLSAETPESGSIVRGQASMVSRLQRSTDHEPLTDGLNERTLVGTKRERAQWRVEGSRVRLYRDRTGEEHWLDIVGNKLMWKGQEIGRVP